MTVKRSRVLAVCVALAVAGCASQTSVGRQYGASSAPPAFADFMDTSSLRPPQGITSESLVKATEAMGFIRQMNLPRASKAINAALQLDGRNSYLHFLNGFIYHLQARQGDSQKSDLAIEGYRTALRLDPGNWIAQEFLGLAFLDQKQFSRAKENFSQVLLLAPDSTVSMYGLMVTSYLSGDPVMACAMADQYRNSVTHPDPTFLRSAVAAYASCGKFAVAERMQSELLQSNVDPLLAERAERRLSQWREVYGSGSAALDGTAAADMHFQQAAAFTVTPRQPEVTAQVPLVAPKAPLPPPPLDSQSDPQSDTQSAASAQETSAAAATPAANASPGMVLVDVVIISTQETMSTSKGINLLNALTLQLGSATAPGYSWSFDSSAASRTVITKQVTIPALAYSLNIANAAASTNEVLARPTLAAIEGLPSEFFAGINVNAGVLSTTTLGSASVVPVEKRFGVSLAVTPNFLADGMVKLKVQAQRTFIVPNGDNNQFSYRFDNSETSTDANVVMKLGDTLVLSGLTEKENSKSRDGVPGLQDVPVAQYLFSQQRKTDFQRSALILITPRAPIYAAKADSETSASEQALRERLGFTSRIPANVESIVNYMSGTELFRQFRQGDVAMERWDRTHTTAERLRQALSFLYY
jgi:Tfp pilus assembly protein PilF